jgi:hypothetical protein
MGRHEVSQSDTLQTPCEQRFPSRVAVDKSITDHEAEAGTVEAATPQSTMPQTGINDTIRLWIYGLCISLLGLGTILCIINKARKED